MIHDVSYEEYHIVFEFLKNATKAATDIVFCTEP
jgi:hypothetical protein